MKKQSKIDIIIPSFNGKHLLKKHLPSVIENTKDLGEIIVIDNGSEDGTVEWLSENYSKVKIIRNSKNLGFTKPVIQGIKLSKSKYFILLNNDVEPYQGYLDTPLKYLEDEKIFSVTFTEKNSTWPNISLDQGKLNFTEGKNTSEAHYSTWASGGSAIFNREIYDKIGGFNPIYAPFYWEDVDLGYRAWKMGYKIIWDNHSLVDHQHESTAKKLDKNYINTVKQRNELLFNWVNITDSKLRARHLVYIFKRVLSHPKYIFIVIKALLKFISNSHTYKSKLSDYEVLANVNIPIKHPDVSVIVVGYKSEDTIKPFLDSLKKSKGSLNIEVVYIDNYSQDKASEIAKKHPLKPIVINNNENVGFSKAVNQAIERSTGEYILLMNPDTRFIGKSLLYLYNFAIKHSGLGAVAPKLLNNNGKIQPSVYKLPSILNAIKYYFFGIKNSYNKYYPGNKTTKVEVAVMAAFLIPRSIYKKIGGLSEKYFLYYEDIDYCQRLFKENLPIYYYPKARIKHAHGASGNFKSHKDSPLYKSAQIYHGKIGFFCLNSVLKLGQKWQKIIRKK